MRYSGRAVIADGTRTVSSRCFLGSTGARRARSPTVEKSREEDDDEAIANTSGSTGYGRRKEAGGAQVVDCGEDESMGSGSIGEVHVDMWGCWREGWGSFVGHN
jgi:hypothetical protein